jgi:hypothetical protein
MALSMSQKFRPGEKVMALYSPEDKSGGGWYKATIIHLESNGNYRVRWDYAADHRDNARPSLASVDPDEIRRLLG